MAGPGLRDGSDGRGKSVPPVSLRADTAAGLAAGAELPVAPPEPFAGRRISFTTWALALAAGASIWVLIFKLI
jgi:hypothetical protein